MYETEKITKDNITSWFDSNYISLIKTEHGYLAEAQRKAALNQVLRYVERQHGNWSAIQQAEVDVSLVQPDYIIEGKIDLVKGENGTVELVDFKSEKKPDMEKMRERLEHYRRQLHIYAYLIEQRTGQKVSKMHLGQSSDKKKSSYKVRVLPPPRSIKMKRIWHEYSLIEKEYSEPIDFKIAEIDETKYESRMYEKGSIRLELSTKETVIDDIKDQMRYSRFSLTGEISRYMNLSCVLISRILSEAVDGFDNLVEAVNKHNEVLDDVIIPKIFNTLYEVKSEQKNEDVDVILLKEPKDSGYYEFSADENLVIEKDHNSFTPEEIKKSFHADTYCFDSKPEKECFLQYISSKKVKEIYFTGMFTANQGDLFVQYYDPESKRIRQYYPDFLAKMNDGSYQLIEVKGDNMIDDEVVKAKAEAAEEMSVASGMKYVMYAGSVLMKQNVLEHPPVTYSDEPSPLLMVAEDPVPYGK